MKTEAIELSNFLEEDMPRMQTMTRRGWIEEGRVDSSSRAVLASKDTDKLSTKTPPYEEYLKLFREEKM